MLRFFKDGKEVLKPKPPLSDPVEEEMKKVPRIYGSNEPEREGLDVMNDGRYNPYHY
jgi:hypothetical protein